MRRLEEKQKEAGDLTNDVVDIHFSTSKVTNSPKYIYVLKNDV